jgi:hypothetical protein
MLDERLKLLSQYADPFACVWVGFLVLKIEQSGVDKINIILGQMNLTVDQPFVIIQDSHLLPPTKGSGYTRCESLRPRL